MSKTQVKEEIVAGALAEFVAPTRLFIVTQLQNSWGKKNWWKNGILEALQEHPSQMNQAEQNYKTYSALAQPDEDDTLHLIDPGFFPEIIKHNWSRIFQRAFNAQSTNVANDVFSYLTEFDPITIWYNQIRVTRNRIFHFDDVEFETIRRALGNCRLLLQHYAPESAKEMQSYIDRLDWSRLSPSSPEQRVPEYLPPQSCKGYKYEYRRTQIDQLVDQLASNSVCSVIVVGCAGTGKRELLRVVAEKLRSDFPDGILYVDATGRQIIEVITELAYQVNVNIGELKSRSPQSIWKKHFADRKSLILIANADELDRSDLLLNNTICKTVLTMFNRGKADQWGQPTVHVPLFNEDESFRFICDLMDHRKLSAPDHKYLREIVQSLGGLPLALLMAAQYLDQTSMSPETFAKRLGDSTKRLDLLQFVDPAERGVLPYIEVQLSQLREKSVFERLSVSAPAGFPEKLALSLVDDITDFPEICLDKLEKMLLIRRISGDRYAYYHQLIHDCASKALAKNAGARSEAMKRYAEWYEALVDEGEKKLVRSGLKMKGAREPHYLFPPVEIENAVTAAAWRLSEDDTVDLLKFREYWRSLRSLLDDRRCADQSLFLLEMAREIARERSSATNKAVLDLVNIEIEAYFALQLGQDYSKLKGRYRDALAELDCAKELEQQRKQLATDEMTHEAAREQLVKIAATRTAARKRTNVKAAIREAEALVASETNELSLLYNLNILGSCYIRNDEYDKAIKVLEQALQIERNRPQDVRSLIITLTALGSALKKDEQYAPALEKYREALALAEQEKTPRSLCELHVEVGELLVLSNDYAGAMAHISSAYHASTESPYLRQITSYRINSVLGVINNEVESRRLHAKTLEQQARQIRQTDERDAALAQAVEAWRAVLPPVEARLAGAVLLGKTHSEFWARIACGTALLGCREEETAVKQFREAVRNAERREEWIGVLIARQNLARALRQMGRLQDALDELTKAELLGMRHVDTDGVMDGMCRGLIEKVWVLLDAHRMAENGNPEYHYPADLLSRARRAAQSAYARLPESEHVMNAMRKAGARLPLPAGFTTAVIRTVKCTVPDGGYGLTEPQPGEPEGIRFDIASVESALPPQHEQFPDGTQICIDYYPCNGGLTANRVVRVK